MVLVETSRLILRVPEIGDAKQLYQAINSSLSELQRWMLSAKNSNMESISHYVEEAIISWKAKEQKDFPMVIVYKDTQNIIGATGFNNRSKPEVPMYEIGYWLDTKFTNQGLATEMVNELTTFAFASFEAQRVQIITQVGNISSQRVAEKCGFILEAILKNYCLDCVSNQPADDMVFVRFK